jgi:hypothetical protein
MATRIPHAGEAHTVRGAPYRQTIIVIAAIANGIALCLANLGPDAARLSDPALRYVIWSCAFSASTSN